MGIPIKTPIVSVTLYLKSLVSNKYLINGIMNKTIEDCLNKIEIPTKIDKFLNEILSKRMIK
jgi:hypothetical protein